MRLAISAVLILLALSACNSPSREFLASQAANRTTTVPADATGSTQDRGPLSDETPTADPLDVNETPGTVPSTTLGTAAESTTTTVTTLAPTTTTVAVVTVDPQEVEDALAELDELLSSLGSALSSIDQAFEQGE